MKNKKLLDSKCFLENVLHLKIEAERLVDEFLTDRIKNKKKKHTSRGILKKSIVYIRTCT